MQAIPSRWEGSYGGSNMASLGAMSLCKEGPKELSEKAARHLSVWVWGIWEEQDTHGHLRFPLPTWVRAPIIPGDHGVIQEPAASSTLGFSQ